MNQLTGQDIYDYLHPKVEEFKEVICTIVPKLFIPTNNYQGDLNAHMPDPKHYGSLDDIIKYHSDQHNYDWKALKRINTSPASLYIDKLSGGIVEIRHRDYPNFMLGYLIFSFGRYNSDVNDLISQYGFVYANGANVKNVYAENWEQFKIKLIEEGKLLNRPAFISGLIERYKYQSTRDKSETNSWFNRER